VRLRTYAAIFLSRPLAAMRFAAQLLPANGLLRARYKLQP
jgi:hypothetical protein